MAKSIQPLLFVLWRWGEMGWKESRQEHSNAKNFSTVKAKREFTLGLREVKTLINLLTDSSSNNNFLCKPRNCSKTSLLFSDMRKPTSYVYKIDGAAACSRYSFAALPSLVHYRSTSYTFLDTHLTTDTPRMDRKLSNIIHIIHLSVGLIFDIWY